MPSRNDIRLLYNAVEATRESVSRINHNNPNHMTYSQVVQWLVDEKMGGQSEHIIRKIMNGEYVLKSPFEAFQKALSDQHEIGTEFQENTHYIKRHGEPQSVGVDVQPAEANQNPEQINAAADIRNIKAAGLVNIFANERLAEEEVNHFVQTGERELFCVAVNLNGQIDLILSLVKRRKTEGRPVNILIADPNDDVLMNALGASFGMDPATLRAECIASLRHLHNFFDNAQKQSKSGVEVRLHKEIINARSWFIDPENTNVGQAYIKPYINRTHPGFIHVYHYQFVYGGVAEQYWDYAKNMWNDSNAQTFESFCTEHPDMFSKET